MGQRINRTTIERLTKIKNLIPGTFICTGINQTNRQKLLNNIAVARTIGYKRMPELNLPIVNRYKVFTYNDILYVARIK